MTLSLPEDIEPFLTTRYEQMRGPAVYCLRLTKPDNLTEAWDREFEHRPDYLEEIEQATKVLYVGATNDLLSRLEDHRDGDVRKSALMRVCTIAELRNVWWYEDADRAFERESGIAIELQNHYPAYYVHQR